MKEMRLLVLAVFLSVLVSSDATADCGYLCREYADTASCLRVPRIDSQMADDCEIIQYCMWEGAGWPIGWYIDCTYTCTGTTCYYV